MTVDDGPGQAEQGGEPEQDERRRLAERLLPELIKKFIEVGVGKLAEGPKDVRHFINEMRLPREVSHYVFAQIDETKNDLYRVVAKEIRDFLEHTNVAEEITNALTKLSFEIKTEIRFVPNTSDERLFPRPDVKAEVSMGKERTGSKEERPKKRSR